MAPKISGIPESPPYRAVLMCAKVLGIELEKVTMSTLKGEHLKEDFLKKNPQHTIPILEDDDGFIVIDSHAIMAYLVAKYGKDDALYPEDYKKRATIDHRLYFDGGILFARGLYTAQTATQRGTKPTKEELNRLKESNQFLDQFLADSGTNYVAGDNLSIADFSIISSVTTWGIFVPYTDYPNIKAYVERFQKLPCYEENKEGLAMCWAFINSKIKEAPKIFGIPESPPYRAVLMCAKALGIELEKVTLSTLKGEHLKEDFLKKNPQHTIPILEDVDGFIVIDSHAIMAYLVAKYGKDDALYPKDYKKRATIDHRLYFDAGILFFRGSYTAQTATQRGTKPTKEELNRLKESYQFLDQFLANRGTKYVAGDNLSIADFSIISSVTTFGIFVPYTDYPNINAYVERFQKLPFYEENKMGLAMCWAVIDSKIKDLNI